MVLESNVVNKAQGQIDNNVAHNLREQSEVKPEGQNERASNRMVELTEDAANRLRDAAYGTSKDMNSCQQLQQEVHKIGCAKQPTDDVLPPLKIEDPNYRHDKEIIEASNFVNKILGKEKDDFGNSSERGAIAQLFEKAIVGGYAGRLVDAINAGLREQGSDLRVRMERPHLEPGKLPRWPPNRVNLVLESLSGRDPHTIDTVQFIDKKWMPPPPPRPRS